MVVVSMVFAFVACTSVQTALAGGEQALLSEVPAAAKKAALTAVKGLKLTKAEMEQENDKTIYELKGSADGKKYSVEVEADGKNVKVEEESDTDPEDASLSTVPATVRQVATGAVKGITLTEVELEKDGERNAYIFKGATKASLFHWGKSYRIKVSMDGKLLSAEEEEDAEDEKD
jgi:uncharacterized membrane protein YkoI